MECLKQDFYDRETLEVAPDLLGKYLIREINGHQLIGKIVEVEAYKGSIDKGAHSYNYKRTPRTEVMFGPPGHAYVYLIYGMYFCLNIVTEKEGEPCAVLIRALEPVKGEDYMAYIRYNKPLEELTPSQRKNLTNGPGKLCKSFHITKEQNGQPLWNNDFYLTEGVPVRQDEIIRSKRINIDYAEEAKDFLWRFSIKDNPCVSVKPDIR
ncbi:MAG TPA: DNA-3-methyladenine glycosylase [Clostridiaceae bacterium]|nr:DNA-3-methyladenine glycosylase [Clostridiaceae bacterium]